MVRSDAELQQAMDRLTEAIHGRHWYMPSYRIVGWGPRDGYVEVLTTAPDHAEALQRMIDTHLIGGDPALYRVEVTTSNLPEQHCAWADLRARAIARR